MKAFLRSALLTPASLILLILACLVLVPNVAPGQTQEEQELTTLLLPFSLLLQRQDAPAFFEQVVQTTINANNNSDEARRAQAIIDNFIDRYRGTNLVNGMGSQIEQRYFDAIRSNDPRVGPYVSGDQSASSPVAWFIHHVEREALRNSSQAKSFFGNGTTDGETPATGPTLPQGGQYAVYDAAFAPITNPPANPFGNSRPFITRGTSLQAFEYPRFNAPEPGDSPQDLFGDNYSTTRIWENERESPAFPSGHSTAGFSESLALAMLVPELFQAMAYRGLDWGYSRLVVGAHYPLDLIGGRITATFSVSRYLENQDHVALVYQASEAFRAVVGEDAIAAAVEDANALVEERRAVYHHRLTYGLPDTGDTSAAPVVPAGAEAILATRFPYLSAEQRREVLRTTQLPPGVVLDNGSGWATLNLFDAAGGYGRIEGTVVVNMDASLGGLHASDVWNNSMSGTGGIFRKEGSGTLTLSGDNTFDSLQIVEGEIVLNGTGNTVGITVMPTDPQGVARLSGTGATSGEIGVLNGGIVAPGASVGTLKVGGASFGEGGIMEWEIQGVTNENDLLLGTAVLDIGATAENPFEMRLITLGEDGEVGLLEGFDPTANYAWTIATFDDIAGFDEAAFKINESDFQNALEGGAFSLILSEDEQMGVVNLQLLFTPVPEPSTIALLVLALGAIALMRQALIKQSDALGFTSSDDGS